MFFWGLIGSLFDGFRNNCRPRVKSCNVLYGCPVGQVRSSYRMAIQNNCNSLCEHCMSIALLECILFQLTQYSSVILCLQLTFSSSQVSNLLGSKKAGKMRIGKKIQSQDTGSLVYEFFPIHEGTEEHFLQEMYYSSSS